MPEEKEGLNFSDFAPSSGAARKAPPARKNAPVAGTYHPVSTIARSDSFEIDFEPDEDGGDSFFADDDEENEQQQDSGRNPGRDSQDEQEDGAAGEIIEEREKDFSRLTDFADAAESSAAEDDFNAGDWSDSEDFSAGADIDDFPPELDEAADDDSTEEDFSAGDEIADDDDDDDDDDEEIDEDFADILASGEAGDFGGLLGSLTVEEAQRRAALSRKEEKKKKAKLAELAELSALQPSSQKKYAPDEDDFSDLSDSDDLPQSSGRSSRPRQVADDEELPQGQRITSSPRRGRKTIAEPGFSPRIIDPAKRGLTEDEADDSDDFAEKISAGDELGEDDVLASIKPQWGDLSQEFDLVIPDVELPRGSDWPDTTDTAGDDDEDGGDDDLWPQASRSKRSGRGGAEEVEDILAGELSDEDFASGGDFADSDASDDDGEVEDDDDFISGKKIATGDNDEIGGFDFLASGNLEDHQDFNASEEFASEDGMSFEDDAGAENADDEENSPAAGDIEEFLKGAKTAVADGDDDEWLKSKDGAAEDDGASWLDGDDLASEDGDFSGMLSGDEYRVDADDEEEEKKLPFDFPAPAPHLSELPPEGEAFVRKVNEVVSHIPPMKDLTAATRAWLDLLHSFPGTLKNKGLLPGTLEFLNRLHSLVGVQNPLLNYINRRRGIPVGAGAAGAGRAAADGGNWDLPAAKDLSVKKLKKDEMVDDGWGLGPIAREEGEDYSGVETAPPAEDEAEKPDGDVPPEDMLPDEEFSFSTADMLMADEDLGLNDLDSEFSEDGELSPEDAAAAASAQEYAGLGGKLHLLHNLAIKWVGLVYKFFDKYLEFNHNWWKIVDFIAILILTFACAAFVSYFLWHKV